MEKVIDIEERIPSMRERRRRRTNRKFIFIVSVFLIALLVILYFQSPFSRIDKFHVVGAKIYEPSFYTDKSELQVDDSLWGFSAKQVEQRLEKIEGVQKAVVSRKWLRGVQITVTEWKPIAYIENDGQFGLLLENGDVFTPEKLAPEEDAPILNGFTDIDVKKRMTEQLIKMENEVYQLISEILYTGRKEEPDFITVFMDDGYEIKAIIPTFAEKMAYYSAIIAQLDGEEKGVIDMEVGTFFTPYSKIYGVTGNEEEAEEEAEEEEQEQEQEEVEYDEESE
ncbi:cell division protein FtsQ/DivIB [Sporosarcina pasteurii]|uniref:Cell division protein DivIB n=1 Tax=Sporosarcina pasteurii TaxID=1474 RepID=A0A380BHB6_SPOPA|nr:cell division protein FtsQ/DivIB [Sporosarcina pasteurii]MDS9470498.1 cell division protein FtsQ/DivIB [Sporosarcina pasteurii]QBQ05806.1 FtsQ-type POTRA domain-containing protein [Sporosarcina pasteurii]SUJ00417.1 Division initiation protein DivIB [Sporosarcina pasteurii]